MSSHLTRRGAVYTFQVRVPSDLVTLFGHSPFWLRLGRIPAGDAARTARILAGQVEAAFLAARGGRRMDRKDVTSTLQEIGSALTDLKRQRFKARFMGSTTPYLPEVDHETGQMIGEDLTDLIPERVRVAAAEAKLLDGVVNRLATIKDAAVRDAASVSDAEVNAARIAEAVAAKLAGRTGSEPIAPALPVPPKPLLSALIAPVIQQREETKGEADSYTQRMKKAGERFVETIGDKPYNDYVPLDIQVFANVLAAVPRSWDKLAWAEGLSFKDMGKRNAEAKEPLPTLSEGSVIDYIRAFRNLWQKATAEFSDVPNLHSYRYDMPNAAMPSISREGLPEAALSKWFALAADAKRPDDKWLPLLGLLTGARLGELVGLRSTDLQQRDGRLVLNLSQQFVDARTEGTASANEAAVGSQESAAPKRRPRLKTSHSRRLISVHDFLHECGFVDWARRQQGFLFERLHATSAPSGTASKRMLRQMRAAGIHVPHQDVFHSLRHTHKDWLEDAGIPEKTRDRHVGHAPANVARGYGCKALKPKEIDAVASAALPEGVDFGPYLKNAATPRTAKPRKRVLKPRS